MIGKMATKYERRMQEVKQLFEELKEESQDFNQKKYSIILNNLIVMARSVTFVLKKELCKNEGFEEWYSKIQKEMKSLGFSNFIEMRNIIEKEGKSVIKGEMIEWRPANKEINGTRKIGRIIKGSVEEPLYGFVKRTHYFDKPTVESSEVFSRLDAYIDYLDKVCNQAKEKFIDTL